MIRHYCPQFRLTKYIHQCIKGFHKITDKEKCLQFGQVNSHSMSHYTQKKTCKEEMTETLYFDQNSQQFTFNIYNKYSTNSLKYVILFTHLWFELSCNKLLICRSKNA